MLQEPIPPLTGKNAVIFIKQIQKPPTKKQLDLMHEAEEVYRKIKRIV